jgi:predicted ATPase/class 3 adenylate cyclase/Tfp pilus assembly protein PilF
VSGTVTFLFTDIEDSTRLWEAQPARMAAVLARHDALCREVVGERGGRVVKTTGDGLYAAFDDPFEALSAAIELQRGIQTLARESDLALKMRCGLHSGAAETRDGDYFGPAVNCAARVMDAAHGGQVLLTQALVDRVEGRRPEGADLLHLGRVRLRGVSSPVDVWQVRHPDLRPTFPPLRALDSIPHNLPRHATSFVGRENQIREVIAHFDTTNLLTLTGAGGCGKSRLALQVATNLLESYPDGAWFVELAALADPSLVPHTVATVLSIADEAGVSVADTLVRHLESRTLLLVLDNAEHLLNACAQLVDLVLRRCRDVKLLVSSREGLGVAGEVIYRVPSLTTPDAKAGATPEHLAAFEAVRLFAVRAQAHVAQFAVTPQNATAVASICRRLDGIPLAIELAVARLRSMTVEEVHRRLDHRFRLLSGGSRTALPRQQTLRSLIDWSYDLLNTVEQALFCRFTVFAGGWTLEAAVAVGGGDGIDEWDVLELLTSLVDKNLVVAEDRNGTTRYRLLETLREYGRDRLRESGDEERWRDRHLAYVVTLAEEAVAQLRGADQQAWLDRLETEHDNVRAALSYARTPGAEASGLRLVAALWFFWLLHGHVAEGRSHLFAALSRVRDQDESIIAKALCGAAILAFEQGDYAAARPLCEDALTMQERSGDRAGMASSWNVLASLASIKGDYESARALYERSLAIRRELGDHSGVAGSLSNLGHLTADQADYATARALYEESLAIRRQLGDKKGIATSLTNMGFVIYRLADYRSARMHLEESLAICRQLGDRAGMADSLCYLGYVATEEGAHLSAWALHAESAAIRLELGDRYGIAESLEGFADVALASARPLRAACIWGAAERLREDIGLPMAPALRPRYDGRVNAARAACANDAAFKAAWHEGSTMTVEQAVVYAEQVDAR